MAGSRLDMLKQIATGLAAQFGDNCEVVVHDLARNVAESSIVHIENGHITGRKVGDGPSGAVLNAIRHQDGPLADRLSYLTKTDSGRILKSSTIYINDDSGKPRYILSINYDITNLLALEGSIHSLTACKVPEESGSETSPWALEWKDSGAYTTWLSAMQERSVIETGVSVTSSDKVLTLSTCTNGGADRFIVMGRLVAVTE